MLERPLPLLELAQRRPERMILVGRLNWPLRALRMGAHMGIADRKQ
jgi:hypothetical protein